MFSRILLVVVLSLVASTQAQTSPRITPRPTLVGTFTNSSSATTNSSSSTSTTNGTTPICCFVVQDTVTENWWQETSYSTSNAVVNLTSITTYITRLPNITTTRVETNTYVTNASFTWSFTVGKNSLSQFINEAPGPTEAPFMLNGTAIITGRVTVQSPAAFYGYNTVKVITAEPVIDEFGNYVCGTPSPGLEGSNFNSNAEAYFGGSGIAGHTETPVHTEITTGAVAFTKEASNTTFEYTETQTSINVSYSTVYTNSAGDAVINSDQPTGVTIALITPFIYQPVARQSENEGPCAHGDRTVDYGYVPQTVLDFLVQNPQYSQQYPGLESCLPGGPSVLPVSICPEPMLAPTYSAIAGPLTSSTTVYVGKQGNDATPTPEGVDGEDTNTQIIQGVSVFQAPTPPPVPDTDPTIPPVAPNPTPLPPPAAEPATDPTPPPAAPNQNPGPLGAIIASIIGVPPPVALPNPIPQPQTFPPDQPVTIVGATTIPLAGAPPGAVGSTQVINNTPVIVIPGPTVIPAAQPSSAGQQPPPGEQPPPAAGALPTVNVQGTPFIVIPGPVNIPLSLAPAGMVGTTSTINGVPVLVVPGPTSVPAWAGQQPPVIPAAGIFLTTTIAGTPFLVIPGPTNIPVSVAPAGLTGQTTTINGTPFLVVPGPTTLPAPANPAAGIFSITTINGTPLLVIPGQTDIPLSLVPAGLTGSTTTINGTPFLVVPSAANVLVPTAAAPPLPGQLTVIGGTTELVINGPTTLPVKPSFPISGQTTVISGVTEVIVSGSTTVAVLNTVSGASTSLSSTGSDSASSTTSSSESGNTASASPSPTSTKKAPKKNGGGKLHPRVKAWWTAVAVVEMGWFLLVIE